MSPFLTSEGANTFGCVVDGEIWLKESGITPFAPLSGTYTNGCFRLRSWRMNDTIFESFNFEIVDQVFRPDTFLLKFSRQEKFYTSYVTRSSTFYPDTVENPGFLIITNIDTFSNTLRFASGTFFFDGVNDQGERIEIRNGRFDVRL